MALILPDVNVLVYAAATDMPEHAAYSSWLEEVRAFEVLGLADAALLGFVRIVTDRRLFDQPLRGTQALDFVDALRGTPRAIRVEPTEATWSALRAFASGDRRFAAKVVPDAWLAALAISHGARLATADRGFGRFDGLDWFDPVQP